MLNSRFDMKDMDLVDVILGVKITRTSDEHLKDMDLDRVHVFS